MAEQFVSKAKFDELLGYVTEMANFMFTKHDEPEGDEGLAGLPPVPGKMPPPSPSGLPSAAPGGMPGAEANLPMEDDLEQDDEAAMKAGFSAGYSAAYKAFTQRRKGYNSAARKRADEHDAPFGEKDSDLKGAEPSPAGRMEGDREDETFGKVSVQKLAAVVKAAVGEELAARGLAGTVVAKSVVPANTGNGAGATATPGGLTREMQAAVKDHPGRFRAINNLREQVGDLPRNLIADR